MNRSPVRGTEMSETIEIKYNGRHIIQDIALYLVILCGYIGWNIYSGKHNFDFGALPIVLGGTFLIALHNYNQLLRVDENGITYRRFFFKQQVRWSEIGFYSARWRDGYRSLFKFHETPDGFNWYGTIKLFDREGHRLFSIAVDFGTRAERNRVRLALIERLQALPEVKREPATPE